MNRILFTVVLLSLAGPPVFAEQLSVPESANLARLAEKIRTSKVDVGREFSMAEKTGRYHIIHADKILMDCSNCHYGDRYKPDLLLVGKERPFPERAKGQYIRSVCLGCHQAGGIATRFYNTSTEQSE